MKQIAAVALLSAFIAAPVAAQDMLAAQDMYIGVNVGSAQIDVPGYDASTALSVLGGYTINSNFAVEVAFVNFGSVDLPLSTTVDSSALSISGVGSYPLNDEAFLIGKLGLASTNLKQTNVPSESNTGLTYGIGAQFNFDKQIGIRAGYDVYKVGNVVTYQVGDAVVTEDETVMSLGAIYTF